MNTILDRYIGLADPAVHDRSVLDELATIFAPDAKVDIFKPVQGFEAIMDFYREHLGYQKDSKHFWNTTVLDDGTLRAEWIAVVRMADDRLMTMAGIEHATLGPDGRITELRNEFTRPPA